MKYFEKVKFELEEDVYFYLTIEKNDEIYKSIHKYKGTVNKIIIGPEPVDDDHGWIPPEIFYEIINPLIVKRTIYHGILFNKFSSDEKYIVNQDYMEKIEK